MRRYVQEGVKREAKAYAEGAASIVISTEMLRSV